MVRDTLGDEAVIVASREDRGGKGVHVTAAIEPHFEISQDGLAAETESWLQYDAEEDESLIAEELTDIMLRHAVPEDVMDNILSCATVVGLERPEVALIAAIEHLFSFRPLPIKPERKPVMMVGVPGAGKTLAVAKAATRGVMEDMNIGVISCDTIRAGGIEQLEAFTKLLKIDLQKAENFRELRYIVADMEEHDQIFIDTAGMNPFNTEDVKRTAKLIGAVDVTTALVMSSGGDADEAGEIARIFSTIGVEALLPTRTDIARRQGSLLSAAHHGTMSFTDTSNTPKVADGLTPLTPKSLSGLLMPSILRGPKIRNRTTVRQKTGTKQ